MPADLGTCTDGEVWRNTGDALGVTEDVLADEDGFDRGWKGI